MNDRFYISQNWITDLHLTIWNSVHQVVLESDYRYVQWDGHDPHSSVSGPTVGFYTYTVSVTGTNGVHFTQDRTLWVITDMHTICFLPQVAPVFGDQFDPRLCGVVYPTNDVVCLYE